MYHFFILCLLLPTTSLVCIETHPQKTVSLQLDDGSQYSIAKWKVKESDTLRKHYYSQKKQTPIIVPNISAERIKLFDKALEEAGEFDYRSLLEGRQVIWFHDNNGRGSFIPMPRGKTREEIIQEHQL
jgi:hypothetical protein